MNKKMQMELLIERAMVAFKCSTQKQLADILNISSENLSNRKRRGTLEKLIEKEAYKRNICYDDIKTGEGEMQENKSDMVAKQSAPHSPPPISSSSTNVDLLLRIIDEQGKRLDDYSDRLKSYEKKLEDYGKQLDAQGRRIDTVTEMFKPETRPEPKASSAGESGG